MSLYTLGVLYCINVYTKCYMVSLCTLGVLYCITMYTKRVL